ncbi:Src kinase-associated phosphoprotein 2 [Varanus komodoensis]|nr:Src kinase-associated phosphoprotein 2 [Varanus komodoensis]
MRKTGLDESPVEIKIAGRNINNLRYADDTTLMAESEEELKSLLIRPDSEDETQILGPPNEKEGLPGEEPNAGNNRWQKKKGTAVDEQALPADDAVNDMIADGVMLRNDDSCCPVPTQTLMPRALGDHCNLLTVGKMIYLLLSLSFSPSLSHFHVGNQFPPVAAQDLQFVLKSGYLEKRRKDHSFLGFEWQKRWCALNRSAFYYYGSEKDKQQKGEFAIDGYTVRMNNTLRKDGKKDCCFEIAAPDKRIYQVGLFMSKIKFLNSLQPQLRKKPGNGYRSSDQCYKVCKLIKNPGSEIIPVDDEEYDDIGASGMPSPQGPTEDDIYEELPGIEGLHSLENLCRSGGSADACDQNTVRQ